MALSNLGTTLQQAGRFEEAISACHDAVAIFRETGDRHGEGMALTNLESAQAAAGRLTAPQDQRADQLLDRLTISTRTHQDAP